MTTNALSRAISLEELEPGDVLLSRGVGSLSDLICSVDGGSYSHAGVWDGQCVVEATLGGIAANPIGHALESQQYVDVYRFCRDGSRLGAHEWPAAPVIGQARSFVGMKYAYADLLLAAVVVALGRRTSLPVMKRALRQLGALAGQQMARKIFCADGRGDACDRGGAEGSDEFAARTAFWGIGFLRHVGWIPSFSWWCRSCCGRVAA